MDRQTQVEEPLSLLERLDEALAKPEFTDGFCEVGGPVLINPGSGGPLGKSGGECRNRGSCTEASRKKRARALGRTARRFRHPGRASTASLGPSDPPRAGMARAANSPSPKPRLCVVVRWSFCQRGLLVAPGCSGVLGLNPRAPLDGSHCRDTVDNVPSFGPSDGIHRPQ
jgi:hypothetical protein